MLRSELLVAIALVISAFASLIVFYFTSAKNVTEGKIQLPIHVDDDEDQCVKYDPFDVAKAEDVTDGYPIQPEAFWRRVSLPKSSFVFVFTC